jgi:hypothetical protein
MSVLEKSAIQTLKENANSHLQRLLWEINSFDIKKTHARNDAFVRHALSISRKHHDVKRLKNCSRESLCQNIYCTRCRNRLATKLLERVRTHIKTQNMDDDAVRARLRWVTILHALDKADIKDIRDTTRRAREEYNLLNDKFKCTWARGAFEYELVDMAKVSARIEKSSSGIRKKYTLQNLGGYESNLIDLDHSWEWEDEFGIKRTDYVLVHTHFLMDCGEGDWDLIKKDINRRWNKSYQVEVKSIWSESERPLQLSLWKMSSYCFKNATKFNYEFGGYVDETSDEKSAELTNEKMFSVNELNTIYDIYKSMAGGKNTGLQLGWNMKV